MREWVIELPWSTPPLSLNSRMHWRERAAITASLMDGTRWLLRREIMSHDLDRLDAVTVWLEWIVPDRRARDTDNPMATTKVLVDALVREGVIADDTPQYVRREETVITYEKGVRRLVFHIREGKS